MLKVEEQKDKDADGEFYMLFDDFYKNFKKVTITYDVTGWHSAYFLMIDDNGTNQVKNIYSKVRVDENGKRLDCPGCYKHSVNVKSAVNQTLFVTAFVVDEARRPK